METRPPVCASGPRLCTQERWGGGGRGTSDVRAGPGDLDGRGPGGGVAPVGGAHQGHGNQPLTPGGFRVPLLRRVTVPGNAHCSPGARAPHRPAPRSWAGLRRRWL